MMMLSREVVQPEDIVFGIVKSNKGEPEPTLEYMRALRKALGEVHHMARERLKTSKQLHNKGWRLGLQARHSQQEGTKF